MRRSTLDFFAMLASAVLLALPFHYPSFWPAAFVALVPVFLSWEYSSRSRITKLCFVCGIIYHALLGYWLTFVNVLGFVVLCLYLSLYYAAFGYFASQFHQSLKLRSAFAVAAIWTVLEYARGVILSGFPWALLGYSQWKNVPMIQFVEWTGAYSVSFLIVWINFLIYAVIKRLREPVRIGDRSAGTRRFLFWIAFVWILVYGYGAWRLSSRETFYVSDQPKASVRIAVVQGNIPQEEKWDERIKGIIFEKYKRLTMMAAMEKPDLVVWPETSFPGFLQDEPRLAASLRQVVRLSQTRLLVGVPTVSDLDKDLKFFNSAVLYGRDGEEKAQYDKVHLVPFGEYVPFESFIGFIRHFFAIGHFSAGEVQTLFPLIIRADHVSIATKFGVLICYEDIFPELVRSLCANGADFLVNITNDAWFGKTSAPYQHAQASVFRAVENRIPVVRSTNTGLSCFITAEGRVVASVKKDGEEIMISGHRTQDVVLRKGRSFYTKFGDMFFWVLIVGLFFCFRDRHRRQGYSKI